MGGDFYDRSVISAKDRLFGNDVMSKQTEFDTFLNPRERNIQIETDALNPIVLGLDITGSMGIWTQVIYDKLPLLIGQIKANNYLEDTAVSFCGIGDATSNKAPLQITPFGRGKQLDQLLSKIWIQKGGGGTDEQSYELAAYFYNRFVNCPNSTSPYFFIIGDEDYYKEVNQKVYEYVLGGKIQQRINGQREFGILKKKFNVFLLRKSYKVNDQKIQKHWVQTLGDEKVIRVESPKACVDVILGLIALSSKKRNLEDYILDMIQRGQSDERIKEVEQALNKYYTFLDSQQYFKQYLPKDRQQKVQTQIIDPSVQQKQIQEKVLMEYQILPVSVLNTIQKQQTESKQQVQLTELIKSKTQTEPKIESSFIKQKIIQTIQIIKENQHLNKSETEEKKEGNQTILLQHPEPIQIYDNDKSKPQKKSEINNKISERTFKQRQLIENTKMENHVIETYYYSSDDPMKEIVYTYLRNHIQKQIVSHLSDTVVDQSQQLYPSLTSSQIKPTQVLSKSNNQNKLSQTLRDN